MMTTTVTDDRFTAWSDAGYPRPQLCRPTWLDLGGTWAFAPDPHEVGIAERWFADRAAIAGTITVPYPPGSKLSGVAPEDTSDVSWYRRTIRPTELPEVDPSHLVLLHFEAVDYSADVWVDGHHVARHDGGFTPFTVSLPPGTAPLEIVVRAEDRRLDLTQPRGKQDWREHTHGIWYEGTNGIWRDVWIEMVPVTHISDVRWSCDLDRASVTCHLGFSTWFSRPSVVEIALSLDGAPLASASIAVSGATATVTMHVPALANRMEWPGLVWTPERPSLLDARLSLHAEGVEDTVVSYVGLRSVTIGKGHLRINHAPVYVRGVLEQGYWQESFLTAPSHDALRDDVELARSLGFNTLRVHQRIPDRRLLTWADRLGMMVWAEFPAAFEFTPSAVERTTAEWLATLRRDSSHPCVVAWVPFNESWGVPAIVTDDSQRAFVDGIVGLTRAIDPSRPVVANDGWEQLDTDIVTIHDYGETGLDLATNYADEASVADTVSGAGPQGRSILLREGAVGERPVIVSEFGGILLASSDDEEWGYSVARDAEEFDRRLIEQFGALRASPELAGYCYTQLTDTRQEANGLCRSDRTPKLPASRLREIVIGSEGEFARHRRPRGIRVNRAEGR